jgi:hypothetical protein
MRTLIYKRVHIGDPDRKTGIFGNNDCMGSVRSWRFDAVIGIGGMGHEPKSYNIAGKLTWVGIRPQPIFGNPDRPRRGPRLRFDHFWYLEEDGPLLEEEYPALARRMYDKKPRAIIHSGSTPRDDLDREVRQILQLAAAMPPSNGTTERDVRNASYKCSVRPTRPAAYRRRSMC